MYVSTQMKWNMVIKRVISLRETAVLPCAKSHGKALYAHGKEHTAFRRRQMRRLPCAKEAVSGSACEIWAWSAIIPRMYLRQSHSSHSLSCNIQLFGKQILIS